MYHWKLHVRFPHVSDILGAPLVSELLVIESGSVQRDHALGALVDVSSQSSGGDLVRVLVPDALADLELDILTLLSDEVLDQLLVLALEEELGMHLAFRRLLLTVRRGGAVSVVALVVLVVAVVVIVLVILACEKKDEQKNQCNMLIGF